MTATIARHGAGGAFSKPLINSNRTVKLVSFDLDITSYSTGGEDISLVVNEFSQVLGVVAEGSAATPGAVFRYDPAAKKVKAFWTGAAVSTALAEVTAAQDLNLVTVLVFGY